MSNKPLIIYHGPSIDGFTGAWILWHYFDRDAEVMSASYKSKVPLAVSGRDVYLVGFAYDPDQMSSLISHAKSVILYGNHKTARMTIPSQTNFKQVYENGDERSPSMTIWKELFKDTPAPIMLSYIEDAYIYRHQLPFSREIRCMMALEKRELDNWTGLMEMSEEDLRPFKETGAVLLKERRKTIHNAIKSTKRWMKIGGVRMLVANIPSSFSSDACNELAYDQPVAATYFDSKDYRHFELRSPRNSSVDVEVIARKYGGGGSNQHAAGFVVPRDHVLARI